MKKTSVKTAKTVLKKGAVSKTSSPAGKAVRGKKSPASEARKSASVKAAFAAADGTRQRRYALQDSQTEFTASGTGLVRTVGGTKMAFDFGGAAVPAFGKSKYMKFVGKKPTHKGAVISGTVTSGNGKKQNAEIVLGNKDVSYGGYNVKITLGNRTAKKKAKLHDIGKLECLAGTFVTLAAPAKKPGRPKKQAEV